MAVIDQEIGENYAIYNGDCVNVLPDLKPESVGMCLYSPPFPELYQYSNDPRDMSNCATYREGIDHYQYVVRQVHRLLKPGRITAVHCMDLKDGSMYQKDFPGDIVRVHQEAGFHFFCRITIWKDPWLIARRTRMKSLMHKTIVNDSSKARVAGADYMLIFRKGGENPEPIMHKNGFKAYAGEVDPPPHLVAKYAKYDGDQKKNLLSHWIWRRYASPVWMDIRGGRLLPYMDSKETEEEKHVCTLQLDVIDRCLALWSNPGDIVLSPFMGVGSEVYEAVVNGRKGIGVELKSTYFRQAAANLKNARPGQSDILEPGMFDGEEFDEDEDEPETEDDAVTDDAEMIEDEDD